MTSTRVVINSFSSVILTQYLLPQYHTMWRCNCVVIAWSCVCKPRRLLVLASTNLVASSILQLAIDNVICDVHAAVHLTSAWWTENAWLDGHCVWLGLPIVILSNLTICPVVSSQAHQLLGELIHITLKCCFDMCVCVWVCGGGVCLFELASLFSSILY